MGNSNIRIAQNKDIDSIKRLIDDNISIDYFSKEKLKNIINNENHYLLISTNDNDDAVAMIYCVIENFNDAVIEACIDGNLEAFSNVNNNPRVLLYKTTCTNKNYRNEGILISFMNEIELVTKSNDFEFSFVIALIHGDENIPVHNILINNGFVKKQLVKKPWNKIKSYCSYCNNEYCTCDGMLYIKEKAFE